MTSKLVGVSIHFKFVTLLHLIFSLSSLHGFLLLCMKGGSCACMPLTSMLTLHPPFEKSGYRPDHSSYKVCHFTLTM